MSNTDAVLVYGTTVRSNSHSQESVRGPVRRLECAGLPAWYVSRMANDTFGAVAHPIRRAIVERLARGPATVGAATGGFGVSKPTISRHLKVLESTGIVARRVQGRTHQLSLQPEALVDAAEWFNRQRAIWERMFDAVDDLLSEPKEDR
jgi:DNA-binding transcriptional ArsR family regulator